MSDAIVERPRRGPANLAETCSSLELAFADLEEIQARGLAEAETWCSNCILVLVALGELHREKLGDFRTMPLEQAAECDEFARLKHRAEEVCDV
jgi:hypothetical protein